MSRKTRRYKQRGGIVSTLVGLLLLAAVCLALYFARHPIMRFGANSWIVNEPAASADAIVVLSDDNFYADRATHAAELFRHGAAPTLVASGRRLRPSAGISELMEHDLIERGVPKEKIVSFPNDADNTIEAAKAVVQFAIQHDWRRLIVVTSNYHTRRAKYVFQRVAPPGMEISVASAPDGDFDPELWWEKPKSTKAFLGELIGMPEAMWDLRGERPGSAPAAAHPKP